MDAALVHYLVQHFDLREKVSAAGIENLLAEKINDLIQNDFESLINLLYRIDVSEKKLKQLLSENRSEDAGKIIAQLIIERQSEKIRSRQKNRDQDNIIDENERW